MFTLWLGNRAYPQIAARDVTLRNEGDALNFVSKYDYPVSFEAGDTIELLGRTVVTAVPKTFEDYRSMEWWCLTADGIPEIGLFNAV